MLTDGHEAARRLLEDGMDAAPLVGESDPLTPDFADAFVGTLADGLHERFGTGIGLNLREGAGRVVRSSNVEREHGLVEVLQNADDLGATQLRFQVVEDRGRQQLLRIAHNGRRALAPHVLAMTLALITTKTDDDLATGKFGVGLKTLARMADSFTVQSWPYAFEVHNQSLRLAERSTAVDGMYEPARPDTLLVLRLEPSYPAEDLDDWFRTLEPEALLFLRSVRRLTLHDARGRVISECGLDLVGQRRETTVQMGGAAVRAEELTLQESGGARRWIRVAVEESVPSGLARTDKRTPLRTPVAVAFPTGGRPGRFYAGLPLAVPARLPFSVNAQFDTETSRTNLLQDEGWTEWLLDRVAALVSAATRHFLEVEPAVAWSHVPLLNQVEEVTDPWLQKRLVQLVEHVHRVLSEDVALPIGSGVELVDLSYESAALDGALTEADLRALAPDETPLPLSLRDQGGRWREVLSALDLGHEVGIDAAMELLSWDESELGPRTGGWFVQMLAVARDEGLEAGLTEDRCLLTADGERISPDRVVADALVLTRHPGGDALVSCLKLVRPLAPAFYEDTRGARAVMEWLRDDVGVRTKGGSAETLQALAGRDPDRPLELDDAAVVELFLAFQRAPTVAGQSGRLIGERILLEGRSTVRGKERRQLVRPAHAYLPQTSWARAARGTAGLSWLNRRYYRLLRREIEGAAEKLADSQAASQFLRSLGAELAPRLVERPTNKQLFGERAALLSLDQLAEEQRRVLDPSETFDGLMGDHVSPDLQAVLVDIGKDRIPRARERAQQLTNAMTRAWHDLYAGREEADAVRAYWSMTRLGKVPATWRALAAETPWMTNERGQRRRPRDLAVKTPAFQAFLGEAPNKFAHGLQVRHASLPVIRALGFEAEPQADTLMSRLDELRDQELAGKRIDPAAVEHCYVALAAMSPDPQARGRARRMGGETVSRVKARFTRGQLVRAAEVWTGPKDVFIGRPIFHRHARFVPATAERLWALMGMSRPTIRDCSKALGNIAELGSPDGEQPTLIETYRHINDLLAEEGAATPRSLASLPLWTGSRWRTDRPVYALRDRTLMEAVAEHVPVWFAPLPVGTVRPLVEGLQVTLLDESTFVPRGINRGSRAQGSSLDTLVQATLKQLQGWLAFHDGDLHDRVASQLGWDKLRG